MKLGLTITQAIIGILVTILVLIQAKGTGLGRSLSSQTYHSRRGVENLVFRICIFLAVAFVGISVTQLFVK